MTLQWTIIGTIAIMMIMVGGTPAPASEETEDQKESTESRHRVELFLGNTHDDGENGLSIGLGYEYRIVEYLGVGLFAEYADGDFREWVFGAPLYIHPYKGWRLLMAPGVDVERGDKGDPEFLFRTGLAYEFEFDAWSVTPEFNVDFVDSDQVFVYGVSFGWGF
jgi:hypothetical protein